MINEGINHLWFYHSHHLLYGELITKIKRLLFLFNFELTALEIMRLVSSFSAAGIIFILFQFFLKKLKLDYKVSLFSLMMYAFSYGFIRYSGEAEIVILASFLGISSVYLSTSNKSSKFLFIVSILISSFSILIHIMNAILIFICIPLYYLLKKEINKLLIFSVSCLFIVFCIYAYFFFNDLLFYENSGIDINFNLGNVVKGLIGISQAIISFDFVLGFSSIRSFLYEAFSNRMLDEEFYFGKNISPLFVYTSLTTLIAFSLSILIGLFYAINYWLSKKYIQITKINKLYVIPIFYLFFYSVIIIMIEPGNPELWIMSLIFLVVLIAPLVIYPLFKLRKKILLWLILLLMIYHNSFAFFQLFKIETNYNYAKTKPVMDVTNSEDIIITACNPVFYRYLYHHSECNIIYLNLLSMDEMVNITSLYSNKNIYILGDVFDQHKSQTIRFPKVTSNIKKFAEKIQKDVEVVEKNNFKGIYKYKLLERK